MGLSLEGTSLAVDRNCQNAYGEFHQLPPGHPFIVEWGINISTVLDGNHDVIAHLPGGRDGRKR